MAEPLQFDTKKLGLTVTRGELYDVLNVSFQAHGWLIAAGLALAEGNLEAAKQHLEEAFQALLKANQRAEQLVAKSEPAADE